MKRTIDIVVAAMALLMLAPVLALVAILIKLDSSGPAIFRQERVGRNFRRFWIYKFRTMVVDAAAVGPPLTTDRDPRITRIGHWLRLAKIDELPQLWNILRGEMSLVGPRPELPRYVDLFREEYREVLRVRPGLTDAASLKYADEARWLMGGSDPDGVYVTQILPDKLAIAREYVKNASLFVDARLLALTALHVCGLRDLLTIEGLFRYRRLYVVFVHFAIIASANYGAFWLRFDGAAPPDEYALWMRMMPWIFLIQALSFVPFRLYEGLWRYTSIWDLRNITFAVCVSQSIVYAVTRWLFATNYSRAAIITDGILLLILLSGVRMLRRIYLELAVLEGEIRTLIFGAGPAAEMIVRQMQNDPARKYEPIGLVDDNPAVRGLRIRGVPVVGPRADLPALMSRLSPDEVLIATPEMEVGARRALVKALQPFRVPIKIVPAMSGLLDVRSAVSDIRSLSLEDLLPRQPVGLDPSQVREMIRGKRVLVTGAGGSIGSELCRQIIEFGPEVLIMLDRYENGLYAVGNEVARSPHRPRFELAIGDVCDTALMTHMFDRHRPHLVFHAAAHKHVPLMELNPCEAVKNNVLGTRTVAETAQRFGAERFILISTDKAVNPSSVMGACKRIAELLVQSMGSNGFTAFVTVRFGNVLGSNGSVVPLFLDQIKAGGPVTVTHPQMRRFFMLIPEAVCLVLHGAAHGEHGALYVLQMGEQVSVLEIAQHLIRLSGHLPDQDIPIVFTGMRPGEKLYEELVGQTETCEPSCVDNVLRVRSLHCLQVDSFKLQLAALERAASSSDTDGVMLQLSSLVGGINKPLAQTEHHNSQQHPRTPELTASAPPLP
jgi:FlaA1/EpsC-like NDP-sugar epimerase/lipopolysaccharide/colanic/teichoic acid biosynthesis glycosyltransferase